MEVNRPLLVHLCEQEDLDARVNAAKASIRSRLDASTESFGLGREFDDGMDYDVVDDKMRKSGRSKNKNTMGIGPRK